MNIPSRSFFHFTLSWFRWTLNFSLKMTRKVFDHCAIATGLLALLANIRIK